MEKFNENSNIEEFGFSEKSTVGSIDSYFEDENIETNEDSLKKEEIIPEVSNSSEGIIESVLEGKDKPLETLDSSISAETTTNTSGLVDKLIESGFIDSDIVISDEDGEEIPVDEIDLTDEQFVSLIKQIFNDKEESIKKSSISTDKISDFTKQLIEIESNGGDITLALEAYNKYKKPMDEIDISTVDGQVDAIYLTLQAKGLGEDDIKSLIKTYDSNGELEKRAKQSKQDLDKAMQKQLDKISEETALQKKEYDKFLSNYSKDMKSNLKSNFELNDEIISKIVEISSKADNTGKFELDKIYNEKRKDAKEAVDLALFLFDKEEYIKQVSNKKVDDNNKKIFSELRLSRRGDNSSSISKQKRRNNRKEISIQDIM